MITPLTADDWWGFMLRAIRHGEEFDASAIGWVGIFPCAGGRDAEAAERLAQALKEARTRVAAELPFRALRRGEPGPDGRAWYRAPGFWIERAPPASAK